MTHPLDIRPLPDGWAEVTPRDARRLMAQLMREQPRPSILDTFRAQVVARALGSDDILLRAAGVEPVFFIAHLSWDRPAQRTDDRLYDVRTPQDLRDYLGPRD